MSFFGKRRKKAQIQSPHGISSQDLHDSPPLPAKSPQRQRTTKSSSPAAFQPDFLSSPQSRPPPLDEFGRPQKSGDVRPAFSSPPRHHIVQDEEPGSDDGMLIYGFWPVCVGVELSEVAAEEAIRLCGEELRLRGLDTPLLFSSTALDLNLDDNVALIRLFAADKDAWKAEIKFASPLALASFIKWTLARFVNVHGGRGICSMLVYVNWAQNEKALNFKPNSLSTHLLPQVSASRLLTTLLALFSSVAAYSTKNGMTPRRLSVLFAAFVFGLSDDKDFDTTYQEWTVMCTATEHLLLAFIRDQKVRSNSSRPLPTTLELFISAYPACLPPGAGRPPSPNVRRLPLGTGKTVEVVRVARNTRFHSRNLIQTAGSWDVPHSAAWTLVTSSPATANGGAKDAAGKENRNAFTPSYRHLLNIRYNPDLEGEEDDGGAEYLQRFRSMADKQWGGFREMGFKEIDENKLRFDLGETERVERKTRHDTLDWSSFTSNGFAGRETFLPTDLAFTPSVTDTVSSWPSSKKVIRDKLHETERALPPFEYDTTPGEQGRIEIDAEFAEAWADVLVASGWARDEMKESSWALVHYKSRAKAGEGQDAPARAGTGKDDRTEEKWFLVEEVVPREYLDSLHDRTAKKSSMTSMANNKRISFLRAVRKKSIKESPSSRRYSSASLPPGSAPPLPTSYPAYPSSATIGGGYGAATVPSRAPLRPVDQSVFQKGAGGETKLMSLSSVELARPMPTPSINDSVRAGHGHDMYTPGSEGRPPGFMGFGVDGTLSSQRRESAFEGRGQPVGYTKPRQQRSVLQRLSLRRSSSVPRDLVRGPAPAEPHTDSERGSMDSYSIVPTPVGDEQAEPEEDIPVQEKRLSVLDMMGKQQADFRSGPFPLGKSPRIGGVAMGRTGSQATTSSLPASIDEEQPPPTPQKDFSPQFTHRVTGSGDSDDPYGGIVAEEGEPVFRGSKYEPEPTAVVDGRPYPVRRLPQPAGIDAARANDATRHESLPPSPKPDADVPQDERYASGVSQYSTRISKIVGMYENRDADARLTQFGFKNDLGQVRE